MANQSTNLLPLGNFKISVKYLELELERFIFHRKWLKIYIIEKLLSHESDFCIKVMYYS